jgi:hypothetical protein
MDLKVLKKRLDGFRTSNGQIRDVSPEVLWELRQAWENFTGPIEQFRSEAGVQTGTLRNLLSASKKLNHAITSASSVGLQAQVSEVEQPGELPLGRGLELIYDRGDKIIRFPDVDTLVEFLKKAS